MRKRILSVLLTLAMLLSLAPAMGITAAAGQAAACPICGEGPDMCPGYWITTDTTHQRYCGYYMEQGDEKPHTFVDDICTECGFTLSALYQGNKYGLKTAFETAEDGGTIQLIHTVTDGDFTVTGKSLTLDENGQSGVDMKVENGAVIVLKNSAATSASGIKFTIKSGGKVTVADGIHSGNLGNNSNEGTLEITGGTFVKRENGGNYVIIGASISGGVFGSNVNNIQKSTISGGSFQCGVITSTISGGKFKNDPSAMTGSSVNTIADGCEVVAIEEGTEDYEAGYRYQVKSPVAQIGENKYFSIADALDAVTESATITLLADAQENVTIPVGLNITLDLNDHVLKAKDAGSVIKVSNSGNLTVKDSTPEKTTRYFTDSDKDGCFETLEESYDTDGKTLGKDYIKTVGGVITGGKATYGGAIYADSYTNLTLDGINIVGSIAESNGGAVNSAYELTVKDCVIAGNLSAGNGGAIACAELSSVTGSKLSYNTAHKEGGAIYSMDSSATSITGTELIGNRVINESETESAAAGGAMSICHKNATITDCTINDNYVYSKYGIAQFAALAASTLTIKNTTVSDNTAEGKNAERIIQAGPISMEDCTVSGNKLIGESSAKILIYLANGDSVIKSSAIKNNTAACTGKAVATAGIEADNVKVSTLTLEGDLVFSGNTFCDIYSINTLDMSKLGSVKDADGQTAKLAYYYKGKITQVFDMTLSTVVEKDLSSYLTAVNNEAYIVNKTAEGGSQVHMLSRILEQPAKANGNTFKLYTEDLKATDVTYQWYKLNGSYLTEEDNVITLVNGTWDGSAINGEYMGPKGGTMVKLTTEEEYLYMYDPDGVYYDIMAGKAEAVTGHSGVYKVTPDNKQITVKASKLLFSKTLVTESAVDGFTSASLNADKTGQYRCIAKVKGTDIISNYVTVDHIHAWSYTLSADGRTVTAKCSDDCSYTGKDTSLTISASGTSYDGNTHGASFGEAKTLCGGTLPAISYQAKNADSTYGAASSDAPVNAGTYKASFTVGTGTAARTASVEYTISPKALSAAGFTVTTDPGSMVYTGKELKPAVTVKDGEKTLTEGTDYTVSYTGNVNAGSATVTVTGIGNYQNSTGGSFTVTKANDNRITGSLSCADITNGRTPAPTGTTAAYGTVKYVYSADGNSWGAWDEVNRGVGKYYVKAVAAGNDNYNGAESDAVSFEVEAADESDEPTNTLAAFLAKILAFYTAFISFFSKLGWAICT